MNETITQRIIGTVLGGFAHCENRYADKTVAALSQQVTQGLLVDQGRGNWSNCLWIYGKTWYVPYSSLLLAG
jgi:hypothetical protein